MPGPEQHGEDRQGQGDVPGGIVPGGGAHGAIVLPRVRQDVEAHGDGLELQRDVGNAADQGKDGHHGRQHLGFAVTRGNKVGNGGDVFLFADGDHARVQAPTEQEQQHTGDEVGDVGANADTADESINYFVGISGDLGEGELGAALGTYDGQLEHQDEELMYEAYYSYPINDGMTITPLVFVKENAEAGTPDQTGVMVKTTFKF